VETEAMIRAALRLSPLVLAATLLVPGPAGPTARAQDPFQPPPEGAGGDEPAATGSGTGNKSSTPARGKAAAKEPEHVFKTNEEWQKILTLDQYMVTRMKATEPPFSGKYATGHYKGIFACVCCGAKLFDAQHKFESGTGWPSFFRPLNVKAIANAWDYLEAEPRVEVMCARCGAHLGHVFQDGPPPTGLRYCINSVAIKLENEARPAATSKTRRATTSRSRTRPTTSKKTQSTGSTAKKSQTPGGKAK
jgi:peptide-methionine (R)-S-oxide reductase